MPAGQLLPLLRRIHKLGAPTNGEADRALLERFARQRDGEAFAALVRRHGPMVLAVCRRVLRHGPDADDAFQAVFLLLVRKAGSLRQPEQLGPWLHGVARRVALKARALGPRRREEPLADVPAAPVLDDLVWRDLRPILDDAIRSLPAKYRAPVVLCYLEGMTHAEAARHLGCPPGTLATRLSRARDQLRARLVRRGVTLSAGVLAAALAGAAEASLPPALMRETLRVLVSPSAIPSHVTALTQGVCQAMLMEKLRFVVMAVVAAAALGALALGYRSRAGEPPAPPPSAPLAVPAPAAEKEATSVTVRSKNFTVTAPTARIARLIADAAERHRKEEAVLWLGKELPPWKDLCPIEIKITPEGTGGATTFEYDKGKVMSRRMQLEGPLDRLLSSALPHEITHTVFADYFGSPVPRWADEGGAVMSEDDEEQQRHASLTRQIAETKERLIPASRLFSLDGYPKDVMALYAEGHSLTRYLVEKKDRITFLAFVKQGMKHDWDRSVKDHYGFADVAALEQAWLKEVRKEPKTDPVVEYGMPMERTGLPEEGPLPGTARIQTDGKGVVLEVIRTKLHYRWTMLRERDGKRINGGVRPKVSHQSLEIALPLSEVKVYRLDGTAVEEKKLAELLKKETPVLVTPDRSAVHKRWLQLVKDDTLLIEVKATELKKKEEPPRSDSVPVPGER